MSSTVSTLWPGGSSTRSSSPPSAAEWPEVRDLRDHWTWRPDWTAHRPRLLWYLTFGDLPHVRSAARPTSRVLEASGADLVPPRWLHLTVTDVGFLDEIDPRAVDASRDAVRQVLHDAPALQLTLGPVGVLPGAVVLPARPPEPLRRLRQSVRRATAQVGVEAPDDIEGAYWPHVSLCYVNAETDHDQLRRAVREAEPTTVDVRCDRLAQVLVTRSGGHYHWEVLDEVCLGAGSARAIRADAGPR